MAILLIGGDKTGNGRWYEQYVPIADELYLIFKLSERKESSKMAKKFSELVRATMSEDAIARAGKRTREMQAEMLLHELRQARGLSQKALAEVLHVEQPAIAKMERRTDMYISTLRAHIEAMGGELEIIARFPDGEVKIRNFTKL